MNQIVFTFLGGEGGEGGVKESFKKKEFSYSFSATKTLFVENFKTNLHFKMSVQIS